MMARFQLSSRCRSVEKIGLLKMDILGLRNLTVVDDTVCLIQKEQGIKLDLNTLSVEDEKTYDSNDGKEILQESFS